MSPSEVNTQKLVNDLKQVVTDAEDLLKATAGQAGEKIHSARARIEESLKAAKEGIIHAEQAAVEKAKLAAKATDEWVHGNPWKAVGMAAAVGFLLGWIFNSRRD